VVARDQVLTIATLLVAFFSSAGTPPVFRVMYEVMPGVKFFPPSGGRQLRVRRPHRHHDGYLVHRWVSGLPPASRIQRAIAACIGGVHPGVRDLAVGDNGRRDGGAKPIISGIVLRRSQPLVLISQPARIGRSVTATILLTVFTTADLAWNNFRRMSPTACAVSPMTCCALIRGTRQSRWSAAPRRAASRTIATASS